MFHRYVSCLVLVVLVGCGESGPQVVPVSGTVTYNGAPLADATLLFTPQTGPTSQAKSDASGKFTLVTAQQANGAVAGEHTVLVTKSEPPKGMTEAQYEALVKSAGAGTELPPRRSVVPEKYSTLQESPLRVTISPAGESDLKVELRD